MRARLRHLNGDEGLSLIEVMVSLVVLALFAAALTATLTQAFHTTANNRLRVQASELASRQISVVQNTDVLSIPDGQVYGTASGGYSTSATTVTVDNIPFTITQDAEYVTSNATTSTCFAPSGSTLAYKRVSVVVTWPNMGSTVAPRLDTLVKMPVTGLDSSTGELSVPVMDQSGNPIAGATVTLSGAGSASAVTGDDGCAVMVGLTPGSYTITATDSGYVNYYGASSATETASVTAANLKQASTLSLGQASAVALALNLPSGYDTPVSLMPVTLYNSTFGSKGFKDCSDPNKSGGFCNVSTNNGSTYTRTVGSPLSTGPVQTGLFPYTSGYSVWAGDCGDSKPSTLTSNATAPAGSTGSGTVNLGGVTITNAATSASEVYAYDSTCSPTTEILDLGSVAAAGTLKVALPFGSWRIQSSGTSTATTAPTGSVWPTATLSNSSPTATVAVTP